MEKKEIIIYHGSSNIVDLPEYGKGNLHNDYGRGFYCTEHIELAKEWACGQPIDGIANKYSLDLTGLEILDLNTEKYNILHWISLLMKNRDFRLDSEFEKQAKEHLIQNYSLDISNIDVITGYRADDSYFSFAKSFLQGGISIRRLSEVMRFGNLGNQIVLVSKKAFSKIQFLGSEVADYSIYYEKRSKRDEMARNEFLGNKRGDFRTDDVFILDLIRGDLK